MRIQTETRSLPTELTAEELAEESQRLAGAVEAVTTQEEHIAELKAAWNEKKKGQEGYLAHLKEEMNDLAAVVESGKADKEIPCSWLYSLPSGFAFLVRDDTQALVQHRKLRDDERQTDLLEVVREPTPEQLEAWIAELGLQVDPQQALPLAEAPIHYYKTIPVSAGIRLYGRFTEADHQPSSLDGVHIEEERAEEGFPEVKSKADLPYETDAETIQFYRRELEDLLAARQAEAVAASKAEEAGAPAPKGRKGK